MIRRTTRIAVAVIVLAALTACSSIPIGTASKLRGLDYLNDDVASLLLAFDLPPSLEPVQGASTIGFEITTPSSGERHIKATLVAADGGDLAGTLPPPSGERNYYLFGFSDPDKQAIREAQAWARMSVRAASSGSSAVFLAVLLGLMLFRQRRMRHVHAQAGRRTGSRLAVGECREFGLKNGAACEPTLVCTDHGYKLGTV